MYNSYAALILLLAVNPLPTVRCIYYQCNSTVMVDIAMQDNQPDYYVMVEIDNNIKCLTPSKLNDKFTVSVANNKDVSMSVFYSCRPNLPHLITCDSGN